jgi:hypothetical protein
MANKRLFLTGMLAGAVGGLLVGRKLANPQPRMPFLSFGQRLLAETQGEIKAAFLAARVQARYDELYTHRPHFHHPALQQHLEKGILPGLALYQTLQEEGVDQETALAEIDRIIKALLERLGRRKLMQLVGSLPDPFSVLRIANLWAMKWIYPPEGWRFEWVEESDQRIAYDARGCFYVNVLTAYGAPELTSHFCKVDDLLFDDFPGVSWGRTKILSQGDDRCDFRFCRVDAVDT